MFRLLFMFLPELLLLGGLYFEILRPAWQNKKLFPITRAIGRGAIGLLPKPTGGDRLLQSSRESLAEAEKRRLAALTEANAAHLEKEAEALEDEATRLRIGYSLNERNPDDDKT